MAHGRSESRLALRFQLTQTNPANEATRLGAVRGLHDSKHLTSLKAVASAMRQMMGCPFQIASRQRFLPQWPRRGNHAPATSTIRRR